MEVIKELKEISPLTTENKDSILEDEVRKAIRRLQNNKSPGNDGITGEMIEHGGVAMVKEIMKCAIRCGNLEGGQARCELKKSILVVLHKKGCALECSNYRTIIIALMSHVGKVLMMLLTDRLCGQVELHFTLELHWVMSKK